MTRQSAAQISWQVSSHQLKETVTCHEQQYLNSKIECVLNSSHSILDLHSFWCPLRYYSNIYYSCYFFSRPKTKNERSLDVVSFHPSSLFVYRQRFWRCSKSLGDLFSKNVQTVSKSRSSTLGSNGFSTYASVTFIFAVYTVVSCFW